MILWLERREKVAAFESYIKDTNAEDDEGGALLKNVSGQAIQLTKHPQQKLQPISLVEEHHHCVGSLTFALKTFINQLSSNSLSKRKLQDLQLPFNNLIASSSYLLLSMPKKSRRRLLEPPH